MKKLMKIGFGTMAFFGVTEVLEWAAIAIMWKELMMRNEDAAADALDNVARNRRYEWEIKLYEFMRNYMAEKYLNH